MEDLNSKIKPRVASLRIAVSSVFAGIFLLAGYTLVHLGVTKDVTLTKGTAGPLLLLGKEHLGPYHTIVSALELVETWAKKNQISCEETFGEYFDDPEHTPEDRLRSFAGCIVNQSPQQVPADFRMSQIEQKEYLIAQFAGAPSISPYKVYPRAKEWLEKNGYAWGGPVIEIYRINSDQSVQTRYLFSLEARKN